MDTETEQRIEFFIAQLKIILFLNMLAELKYNQYWNFGDIFSYVIAQHYGIRIQFLDITDDLAVALFFACFKYTGNVKYQLVSESDIAENNFISYAISYKRIDNFSASADPKQWQQCTSNWLLTFYLLLCRGAILLIQCGQVDLVNYDLVADHGLKKLYFKRPHEFAVGIYEIFDGDRELFHDLSMEI